ncbi:MAG: DUF3365 domain-containing protein [Gordonibacter pamelaeae]
MTDFQGVERFRYAQALEVDKSCLECHGEPAGEVDITGKVKEGWTLDSVGGAISIVIPSTSNSRPCATTWCATWRTSCSSRCSSVPWCTP